MIEFAIAGDHAILDDILLNWQVEVWRKPSGGTWGREITGLYRYLHWSYSDDNSAVIMCPGLMSMLGWRIVAWTAAYTDRSKFTSEKAETIANTLVKYNATSDATTGNGRERDGAITGLTVEADGAEGNTIDWYCAYDNLLTSLQDLTLVGGGDFDLVKTSSTAWQWRWYTGQLGTDNSSSVTFALERGNMGNPVYIDNRLNEKTACIVGGQGEEANRTIEIRTGTNYNASTNNTEMFEQATDITTQAGLQSRGDKALAEVEAVKEFRFDVLQIPGCEYGDDYVLGDKVTAVNPYDQTAYTVKVQSVSVAIKEDGTEDINVEMSEPI
jgi:hypothetical protein